LILEIVGETVDGVDFDAPPIKYYFNWLKINFINHFNNFIF
jgi:hypothetical protein